MRIQQLTAWIADPRRRRIAYIVLALVLAVLCIVPRPYVARAKVVPQDSSSISASTT